MSSNNLCDFISTSPGFQYSINIKYDLKNPTKVTNYIPLSQSVDIIRDVLLSNSMGNNQRSRQIIGSYGTGKSHLATVITSIMGKVLSQEEYGEFLRKVENIEIDTAKLISQQLCEESQKMLPVIISGGQKDIDTCLLTALQQTLKEYDLETIMPATIFSAAITQIELWEKAYPDAFRQMNTYVKANKSKVDDFIIKLRACDEKSYALFEKAYKHVTHGAAFQPLLQGKIEDVYLEVAKCLPNQYKGIFIVFDEFGKYLENQWDKNQSVDLKSIQDLAEVCNSSGETCLQLVLITHKPIAQYAANYSQDLVNEWKKIEGRFKTIELISQTSKIYEIMSNVILKQQDKWEPFKHEHEEEFKNLHGVINNTRIFSDLDNGRFEKEVLEGAFPLHPVATFCLPRFSQQVAQNERTIFTFLASTDAYSFNEFINNTATQDFQLLTIDILYDYFESQMKSVDSNDHIRQVWMQTEAALRRLNDNEANEKKIIKGIAVIKTVGLPAIFPATQKTLKTAFWYSSMDTSEYGRALQNLLNKKILFEGLSTGVLEIIEPGELDVANELNKILPKRESVFEMWSFLNQHFVPQPVLAKKYNDEYTMTRYFSCRYVAANNIVTLAQEYIEQHTDKDGMIYYVLPIGENEVQEVVVNLTQDSPERTIFIIAKQTTKDMLSQLELLLRKLDGLKIIRESIDDDKKFFKEKLELALWIKDVEIKISSILEQLFSFENVCVYQQKMQKIVNSKAELNRLVSGICSEYYHKTPKFNNEMINKHMLTTPIIRARQKILDGLLQPYLQENLGISGNGPEIAIYRSILLAKDKRIVIQTDDNVFINSFSDMQDKGLLAVLEAIQHKINESYDEGISFAEIINFLCSPPFGVRKGMIPILLAIFMHGKKNEIQLLDKDGIERMLSGESLELAMKHAQNFIIIKSEWSVERAHFCQVMLDVFSEYTDKEATLISITRQVSDGFRRWFVSLPKITRDTKIVSKEARQFRKVIRNINTASAKLLFQEVPHIFGLNTIDSENIESVILQIKAIKEEMDAYIFSVIYEMEEKLLKKLPKHILRDNSLLSAMKEWYGNLAINQQQRLYSDGTQEIMKVIEDFSGEDSFSFTKKIIASLTGLRVEDWSDATPIGIDQELVHMVREVEAFQAQKVEEIAATISSGIAIQYVDSKGEMTQKTFPKNEISSSGQLLKNILKAYIGEYGDAITNNEKRYILVTLLKELS